MSYGRYFEEFTQGQALQHWPGRTITEADCTWFALLTMNQHPVHSDANYAEKHTQHGQRLVLGPLVFSIGIGVTVYAETTVLELTASKRGDRGVVHVETRVTNQRGEVVMTFRRKALVPKRNHATLGEAAFARARPPRALE